MAYLVRFTAEIVTEESAAIGDADRRGWVDPDWSRREIIENREDAPSFELATREEALEFIDSEIGPVETSDGETFYAIDSDIDYRTGEYWNYAAHIEEDQS